MSDVDICNLGLSHIGDPGLITSIAPPDGSRQAALCARFYPIARKVILEANDWSFNTVRDTLTLLSSDNDVGAWIYRYLRPAGALRVSKVLLASTRSYEPSEPFITEMNSAGEVTILTNVEEATVVYTVDQIDTSKYIPSFVTAFSFLMSSYLAGPIIKGKGGVAVADGMFKQYIVHKSAAAMSDTAQQKLDRSGIEPSGIASRR